MVKSDIRSDEFPSAPGGHDLTLKSCPFSAKIEKLLKSDTKSPSDRVLFRHWFSRTKKKGMPRIETFPEFAFASNTLLL